MLSNSRLKNGRFVKRKVAERNTKAIAHMSEKKKKCLGEVLIKSQAENGIGEGLRLVDLKQFGKNLKCFDCKQLLDLEKITDEKRIGLHSVLSVWCNSCKKSTPVHMGKIENNASHINIAVILGAVHSGTGNTVLNKIFACANVPSISTDLYKRYEKMVGESMEQEAKASCKRAAIEERNLVIKNIDKLCKELPQEIVEDIYPHYIALKASLAKDTADPEAPNIAFDAALGEIISIVVGFDTGWTKRANGRSYDSLNSYSCIIGLLSHKILDYATRNRKCRLCDAGHKPEDHDCRKNFERSAKAAEADAGIELINHSKILKEVGLQPRVIIGDEDSSMIAGVRKDNPNITYHKIADKNHLSKNFANELYKMRDTHKELNRKGVIKHIKKKCFSYAVSQNKGKSQQLATTLNQIPDHLFGNHENCGTWCKPKGKHTVRLSSPALYDALVQFFTKYALNAHKFSIAASSQANESWNNIVAHKNPKNVCLSTSASSDFRVADSVCVKNDGESCILKYRKAMGLSEGTYAAKYVIRADRKRLRRAEKDILHSSKLRRVQLQNKRELLRKSNEKSEGVQYQSNCAFDEVLSQIEKNSGEISEASTNIVYFDLETTGFGANADILQIAAQKDDNMFNVYINSTKQIAASATKVTGLHNVNGSLYLHDELLQTTEVTEALKQFQQFLDSLSETKKCLLVAHKATTFDMPRLLRTIINHNMLQNFKAIVGFSDTYPVFKKLLPERKDQFTLSSLAKDFVEPDDTGRFHDAVYDVTVLQKLSRALNAENDLYKSSKTLYECNMNLAKNAKANHNLQFLSELQKIVSSLILKRLALNDISDDTLLKIYENEGEEGIRKLFTDATENEKFRITKDKKILAKVIEFLKNTN